VKRKKDLVPAALLGLTPGLLLHGHAPAAAHGALALALGGLDAVAVAGDVAGLVLLLLVRPGEVVSDGLGLVEGAETFLVDDGLVDENVLGAILGGDEAETLLGVEELDGALERHVY